MEYPKCNVPYKNDRDSCRGIVCNINPKTGKYYALCKPCREKANARAGEYRQRPEVKDRIRKSRRNRSEIYVDPSDEAILERFWSKVDKNGECWRWTDYTDGGYGYFWCNGGQLSPHRVAYILTYGEIPDGLGVHHDCDTPSCVNPDHLYAGTAKENAQDREIRGRSRDVRGEKNDQAKITLKRANEMRDLFYDGWTIKEIVLGYDTTSSIVSGVIYGRTWKPYAGFVGFPKRLRRFKLKGELNPASKLTWDKVAEIREQYKGGRRKAQLATDFGVARIQITNVITNKTWYDPNYDPPSKFVGHFE